MQRKCFSFCTLDKLEPDSQCLVDQTPKSSSKCSFISIEEGHTPFHDTLLPLDLTVHKQLDDCPEQFEGLYNINYSRVLFHNVSNKNQLRLQVSKLS